MTTISALPSSSCCGLIKGGLPRRFFCVGREVNEDDEDEDNDNDDVDDEDEVEAELFLLFCDFLVPSGFFARFFFCEEYF
jgi:hypothetical protein